LGKINLRGKEKALDENTAMGTSAIKADSIPELVKINGIGLLK
jgi:hypothetical protein